jgi:subtilase family serine protease
MAKRLRTVSTAIALFSPAFCLHASAQHKQTVTSYVLPQAPVTSQVPATMILHLAIGLPLRDEAGLRALAADVSNPASSNFRHFLTLDQLTERFGPSAADYQALIAWAQANHLTVETQYPHRLLLGVSGSTFDVEKALAVKLGYAKRSDGSTFYRPDRAPSLDLDVKVSHIAGVDNLFLPRHHGGSLLGGAAYGSHDLRNAYAAACLGLTGAGESVGIMSDAAYLHSDITTYENKTHIAHTSACGASTAGSAPCLKNVHIPSTYTPVVNSGTPEITSDIELAIAMAPGLHQVRVFQADFSTGCTAGDSIFSAWLAATDIKQFSSSISYCVSDDVSTLEMMAAAGQSVFYPSGDDGTGAITTGNELYFNSFLQSELTPVGGTVLTMKGKGASYQSEQAWYYSGGGVENYPAFPTTCTPGCTPGTSGCPSNCVPSYQAGVANASNGASSTYRNDPDIAMPSQGLFVVISGSSDTFCGTSASAPMMAGFMALANQQQCASQPSTCSKGLGFISPALYEIGLDAPTFASSFHDVVGNATQASSCIAISGANNPAAPAVTGYDLATGWGSPTCGLVDQLSCTTCKGKKASPGTLPSTSCVSFQSDPKNCGSCGNVCAKGSSCVAGSCSP